MAIKLSVIDRTKLFIRDTNRWSLLTVAIVCIICIPLFTIIGNLSGGVGEMWSHVAEYLLIDYLSNSFVLLIGTGILALLFGVPAAWFISNYDFPFRNALNWLLYIPLAIPSYIMSYAYVGMFGHGGSLEKLGNALGFGGFNISMMNIWGLMFVLSISLYPYVFASSRVMFSSASGSIKESAELLGISHKRYFWKIALPVASPAIFGGLFLVLMEVLNDYGAAKYYGINTFTTGIFRTWTALEDLQTAIYLAFILVVLVLILMSINKAIRGRKSYVTPDLAQTDIQRRKPIGSFQKVGIPIICALPFVLGFLLPVLQLGYWATFHLHEQLSTDFLWISTQSLFIAVIASLITVSVTVMLVFFPKWSPQKFTKSLIKLSTVGYIIPGAVIGITLVASSGFFVRSFNDWFGLEIGYLIYSGLFLLLFAYLFRFLAVAYNPIEAHSLRVGSNLAESAYMLGKSRIRTLFNIELPLLKSSLVSGFLIVFIDVMKELPLTLLLKPYQLQTLAIKAYEYADDERVSEAAITSLILILIVCATMFIVTKLSNDQK
ncbi:MAG: iron ABC transporter permease [Balneolaceae bacterium]|nr:iron ABC transporter permease [Balneolaceae bacterium]